MIQRILATRLENNPALGWFGSILSIFTGLYNWLMVHSGVITTSLGWLATIFGVMAGYYTWRIQRLRFKRLEREDHQTPGK
jgi:hypothetical protein